MLWNETSEARRVTKLQFVSDAYSFTSATITLATALTELEGRGQVALELADAKISVERYPHDYEWSFAFEQDRVFVVDTAPAPTRLELLPTTGFSDAKLRRGSQLGRRTRQFRATCEGMKSATYNLKMAHELFKHENAKRVTRDTAPKRLQWLHCDRSLQVGFGADNSWYSKLAYPFLEFVGPVEKIDHQMELSLDDMSALWEVAAQFGEDLTGFIADGDVADAAFCIDHVFGNGDRVEYISPMVLGLSMARTLVCQDFVAETAMQTEDA